MARSVGVTVVLLLLVILVIMSRPTSAMGDSSKDKEECRDELVGLATCLPYVGGTAKSPTPDCCSGLKQVLKDKKKCLCMIIKERNDPDLGLQINLTLALGLPTVCHAPANVSQCPDLLHMDPKSPEAQVFYQLGRKGSSTDAAPSPSSIPTVVEGNYKEKSTSTAPKPNNIINGCYSISNGVREIVAAALLLSYFIASFQLIGTI